MEEKDFARFEFKMSLQQISYIAYSPALIDTNGLYRGSPDAIYVMIYNQSIWHMMVHHVYHKMAVSAEYTRVPRNNYNISHKIRTWVFVVLFGRGISSFSSWFALLVVKMMWWDIKQTTVKHCNSTPPHPHPQIPPTTTPPPTTTIHRPTIVLWGLSNQLFSIQPR